jgi:antitoxin component of MazEF toxin-antitoxin module
VEGPPWHFLRGGSARIDLVSSFGDIDGSSRPNTAIFTDRLDLLIAVCEHMSMAREIVKVRRVAGSMVVTLPQPILDEVQIAEGDKVLLESFPPDRIFIIKEHKKMPSTRRAELELEVLESRKNLLESEIAVVTQNNRNMPGEPGQERWLMPCCATFPTMTRGS